MPLARKRWGQHFLKDKNVIAHIIQAIREDEDATLIEIGPGKGALTLPLLRKHGRLTVIEIDPRLCARLKKKCQGLGEMALHQGDVLKMDFSRFPASNITIIGNLPYNISTPLIFHLLQFANIRQILITLQQEVVDRICARANSPHYGRLSVMVKARCETEKLFNIPAAAFEPPPKVQSAVLRLLTTSALSRRIRCHADFAELVRLAFSHRRKMISNSLKHLISGEQLRELNISPQARAGELPLDAYIHLANTLTQSRANNTR